MNLIGQAYQESGHDLAYAIAFDSLGDSKPLSSIADAIRWVANR
ncbi:MAG: hypothetical protein NZ805_12480 [Armatimonadetes bacterium]|nr:hypothetical protein [Armatimonadota bacterium]MDW8029641.1 hypothetical protein [Armatimonadota bacterium]